MRLVAVSKANLPALSVLARDTFTETFGHLYPASDLSYFLDTSYAIDKLAAQVSDDSEMWRVTMENDGTLSSYLQCGPVSLPHPHADPSVHGEIKRIYVRQSHQGKGYGRLLMDAASAWLDARYGRAPQWLGVWSGNVKAQAFYAGLGFEKAGAYVFPVGETRDDEFILRRMPPAQP